MIATKYKNVKYRKHGVLKHMVTREGKEVWVFETEEEIIDMSDYELIDVLNDLSMEGWELVCNMEDGKGYILRSKDEKEETFEYYEDE